MGDDGIRQLVDALLQQHGKNNVAPEIQSATNDIVSDVMSAAFLKEDGDNQSEDREVSEKRQQTSGLCMKQLDIGDCRLTSESADHIARLIEASTNISSLSLTGNADIDKEGWKKIALSLQKNNTLTTLSLDYCNLGSAGMISIARALKNNTSLKSIDLEGNKIGEAGAKSLLSTLGGKNGLEDITIMPGNTINETTITAIRESIASRNALQR